MSLTKVDPDMLDGGGAASLPLTLKGQLLGHNGSVPAPVPPGANGQAVVYDSTQATGLGAAPISSTRLPGEIIMGAFAATPALFLPCDGLAVPRLTYSALFVALGTTWGAGDGVNTFNVPDLRGRSPLGQGTGLSRFTISGINTVTNVLTIPSSDLQTGAGVVYTTTGTPPETLPGPLNLVSGTTYYWIRLTATTGMLAYTRADAIAGTSINISTVGTGTQSLQVNLSARTVGQLGGEENHTLTVAELAPHTHNNGYPPTGSAGGSESGRGAGATTSAGSGVEHNTVHPFAVVGFYIYAGV